MWRLDPRKTPLQRFVWRVRDADPAPVATILAFPILGNGLWFIVFPELFDNIPSYAVLQALGPPRAVGVVFAFTGVAVVVTRFVRVRMRWVRTAALTTLFVCYSLLLVTLMTYRNSGGIPVYGSLGIASLWALYLDGRDGG